MTVHLFSNTSYLSTGECIETIKVIHFPLQITLRSMCPNFYTGYISVLIYFPTCWIQWINSSFIINIKGVFPVEDVYSTTKVKTKAQCEGGCLFSSEILTSGQGSLPALMHSLTSVKGKVRHSVPVSSRHSLISRCKWGMTPLARGKVKTYGLLHSQRTGPPKPLRRKNVHFVRSLGGNKVV